jgi:hypothetical protein
VTLMDGLAVEGPRKPDAGLPAGPRIRSASSRLPSDPSKALLAALVHTCLRRPSTVMRRGAVSQAVTL